jgi:hypothetical protein
VYPIDHDIQPDFLSIFRSPKIWILKTLSRHDCCTTDSGGGDTVTTKYKDNKNTTEAGIPAIYLGCSKFECQAREVSMVFFSPCRQLQEQYLKIGHDHFNSLPFNSVIQINPVI